MQRARRRKRRREALEAGDEDARRQTRVAVEGCTTDDPDRHFIGWADEVDADALFASGDAWGIKLVRRTV